MGRLIHRADKNGDMRVVAEVDDDGSFYLIERNGDIRYGGKIESNGKEKE